MLLMFRYREAVFNAGSRTGGRDTFFCAAKSPVGWARFLCPRRFKAVAFERWAEKHCPPYNLHHQ